MVGWLMETKLAGEIASFDGLVKILMPLSASFAGSPAVRVSAENAMILLNYVLINSCLSESIGKILLHMTKANISMGILS